MAPGVERIIDFELALQVFPILGETQAVAGGDRFQAAGDGILVEVAGNIRRKDDSGQPEQARLLQSEFLDDGLERTVVFRVAQFDVGRVKGDCAGLLGRFLDLTGGDEQELGIAVDEAGDQPRAGDAVHMDMRTGDPQHGEPLFRPSPANG